MTQITTKPSEYLEAARSEDLQSSEVEQLSVLTEFEQAMLSSLKGPGDICSKVREELEKQHFLDAQK